MQINVREAKTKLSRLLELVEEGENGRDSPQRPPGGGTRSSPATERVSVWRGARSPIGACWGRLVATHD
jgi:hypothetical protein